MGVGFSLTVEANFDKARAEFEKLAGKTFKTCESGEGMKSCELEVGEKRTMMIVAGENGKSKTTLCSAATTSTPSRADCLWNPPGCWKTTCPIVRVPQLDHARLREIPMALGRLALAQRGIPLAEAAPCGRRRTQNARVKTPRRVRPLRAPPVRPVPEPRPRSSARFSRPAR
jgi:hypothetical protein